MTYEDEDESFGLYDGECQGCGLFGRVNDFSLCEECAGKLDREQYGKELEFIAPKEKKKKKNHRHKKKGIGKIR
jgi:hypothetical protein